ncbi:MAG: hypothetical protein IPH94_05325 [Saprospiraceae bacterium]|nr:hypothetical protein [Saprospiraceae bacterium]MBK8851130.1 hypothetical protein [Saprospiraceae bacterium]MBK9689087.1 hypothetical protein [Saprospiraceae bacterium]
MLGRVSFVQFITSYFLNFTVEHIKKCTLTKGSIAEIKFDDGVVLNLKTANYEISEFYSDGRADAHEWCGVIKIDI